MIKTVAKIQGIILIILAVSSLLAGGKALHGALHIELMQNIIHLLAGSWLVFAGFTRSEIAAYVSVAIISAMFLLIGIPALVSSGIVENDYSWVHEVIRLVVAGLGVIALIALTAEKLNRGEE